MSVSFKVDKKEGLEALREIRRPFEVALWHTENSFNFGATIRTAHNFLASKIWGLDLQLDKLNPKKYPFYKRAAMTTLKWEKENIFCVSTKEFLDLNENRNIVVFERREQLNSQDIRSFVYPDNPILFFGSEKFGVPEGVMNAAHSIVSIPCDGFCLDLNIGVAAGIAMYDFVSKL